MVFIIIGCSGAIGLQLAEKILSIKGDKSVVAALHRTSLPSYLESKVICEFGFNIQSDETIRALLTKYKDTIEGIWNLAAPLSVDTAKDPEKAHDITVGGMSRLLSAMKDILNIEQCRVFFSDSIGSYGSSSPRLGSSAKWLIENPNQDPGSDYGKQKRECRDLLTIYRNQHNFDCRFAIIPGVLHNQSSWGGGTTEYALDCIAAAVLGKSYICPIAFDVQLPMVHSDDLIIGLINLMEVSKESISKEIGGVAICGFSFSPHQLLIELNKYYPNFTIEYDNSINPMASLFANLWPDSLDKEEAKTAIGYESKYGLEETVKNIIDGHKSRMK